MPRFARKRRNDMTQKFRVQVGKSVDEQVQEQSQDLLDKMPQELVEEVFRAQIHKKDGQRGTNVAWIVFEETSKREVVLL